MKHLIKPSTGNRSGNCGDNDDGKLYDFDYCAGCIIRKLRRERCMSGVDVGYSIGYSQQQVSRYECGNTQFTLAVLERFACVFGITLWDLLDAIKLFYFTCSDDYFRLNNHPGLTESDRNGKWGLR